MKETISTTDLDSIILACEAGMGSSLMVVNSLKKKMKKAKVSGVSISHKAARTVPVDTPFVIVHEGLSQVIRKAAPNAVIVTFKHFMNDPALEKVVKAFVEQGEIQNTVPYDNANS